jgi:hypothetical protein
VPGHDDAFLGSTDIVVAEFRAARGATYYVRLRAVDLANNTSPWSPAASWSP